MKFILCSVFFAHGAVVYTVCPPFSGGVCQVPNKNRINKLDICVIPVVSEGRRPKSHASSHNKKKLPVPSMHLLNSSKRHEVPICVLRRKQEQHNNLSYCCAPTKTQHGWQMDKDLFVDVSHNTKIRFTINVNGHIEKVMVNPFISSVYQKVCDQLQQIHFTWHGTSPPPAHTIFEKRICLR